MYLGLFGNKKYTQSLIYSKIIVHVAMVIIPDIITETSQNYS
jgi:hypothetical protein